MTKPSTKERIIEESLRLFSEKGYDGVSMREIAAAVQIKAASLYTHFEGKNAIYAAIVETMKEHYKQKTRSMSIDGGDPLMDAAVYEHISPELLYSMGKELFLFFIHDEYTCRYRKMLTIGQFQSPLLASEYSRQYFDEAIAYQRQLFTQRAEHNFKKVDCEILAVQFYAPIYMLITIYDRQPEREEELLGLLKGHINQFVELATQN